MADVEHRVSVIEDDLKELVYAQRKTEMMVQRLTEEMSEFKNEMSEFKNEMSDFKEEMSQFKDEMSEFKNEMRDFKDEMSEFKNEAKAERVAMNRRWGDLANKLGTLVEDIILPGFPGILKRYFDAEPFITMPSVQRQHPNDKSRMREFDIVAVDATRVFVNETKSKPTIAAAERFVESHREVLEFFPEYADRQVVPFFSALFLPSLIVDFLSQNGCYALALGDEHLEMLNFDAVGAP